MSLTIRSRDIPARHLPGPPLLFGLALAATAAAVAFAGRSLPQGILFPLTATLLFVLAAAMALIAWLYRNSNDQSRLTYWDVAGALTLIGIFAAAAVEPEQLVALVEGAHREPR